MRGVLVEEKYVPVPPYRGRWWPRVVAVLAAWHRRRRYGIERVTCVGAEKLAASVRSGCGVMLTPNHCRDEDPLVLSELTRCVGTPVYIVASWHLFKRSALTAFLLRRGGAFSIYREGMDRAAVNTSVEILETAERPLVIFPEGHITRTNDVLAPLMDGTALIARQAAKKAAKLPTPRKVVVHPVAMRYRFLGDAGRAAEAVLEEIERRMTWRSGAGTPVRQRLAKVGAGLLALKELEFLGRTQSGTIAERLAGLRQALLVPLEDAWCGGRHDGHTVARVKRLRTAVLPDLIEGEALSEAERESRWRQLEDAELAQLLEHYPPDYVTDGCDEMRVLETVERFESDLTGGTVRLHGRFEATVTVGDAIDVTARTEGDELMEAVEAGLKAMLGAGK